MLKNAQLTLELCKFLWAVAANTGTLLKTDLIVQSSSVDACCNFEGVENWIHPNFCFKFEKRCIRTDHRQKSE